MPDSVKCNFLYHHRIFFCKNGYGGGILLRRSDLALENLPESGGVPGIASCGYRRFGTAVTRVTVEGEPAVKAAQKPEGCYVTIETNAFGETGCGREGEIRAAAAEIRKLLPEEGTVLVVGLGNGALTPDSLGPRTVRRILATRGMPEGLRNQLGGKLRPVATAIAGVSGETGIEASELIAAIAGSVRPAAVIAVDSLAARDARRLGRTIQISDSGIVPGSGVAGSGKEISAHTVGVPVVAVGVPTVADCESDGLRLSLTPRDIDALIRRASATLADAVNLALQPAIDLSDLREITGA